MTAFVVALVLSQTCPSYTRTSSGNTRDCAVDAAAGTNPTVDAWQTIFELASRGPAAWGNDGPAISAIGIGCNKPTPPTSTPARFPCELVKAIAMQESSWRQFCAPTEPSDQTQRPSQTIIASDCGYGVAQVTSGMRTFDPMPNFDRARVASEPLYNLGSGLQLFADKWRVTACVGDNQPSVIEHWYSATWAYNGLSATNNPNHPAFSTTRGVCRPGSCPGGSAPYQERVFGWLEFPPTAAHWPATLPAYPRLSDIGAGVSRPPELPEPSCASPTTCAQERPVNRTRCVDTVVRDAGTTNPTDAGTASDAGSTDDDEADAGRLGSGKTNAATGCSCASAQLVISLPLMTRRRRRAKKQ